MVMHLPAMRVHAWGGFGSQLFAVAMAFELRERYPKRNLRIVLHTGGVTRRFPEICELFPEYDYVKIDDFSVLDRMGAKEKSNFDLSLVKKLNRHLALKLGFLAEENDGISSKARGWTFSVRGHYFHRKIDEAFFRILYERLLGQIHPEDHDYLSCTLVHYRLGDLLDLETKDAISSNRIIAALNLEREVAKILVLSDSPQTAVSILNQGLSQEMFFMAELDSVQTLFAAARAKRFLGTSSKISYWAIFLRINCTHMEESKMPVEDKYVFTNILGSSKGIEFY
jgi:hypothetical protein